MKDFLFINVHNHAISYHMKLIISLKKKGNFLVQVNSVQPKEILQFYYSFASIMFSKATEE